MYLAFFLATQAAVPSRTFVGQPFGNNPDNNITVAVNVPSGNSNELFFHFSAPAGQSYAAFGLGSQMKGALIFVTYSSEDDKNVTVSPRIGTGHTQPKHTDDVKVDLLSGTGIIDGNYVVNAKCSNCRTWDGGSVDVNSDSQSMIWAVGNSGDIKSNDVGATITQHEAYAGFNLDFKAATGDPGVPVPDNSSDNTEIIGGPGGSNRNRGIAFHAFLMVAAFLVVFPGGYLFLRVFEKVWLHWGIQSFALLMVTIGTGVGVGISKRDNIVRHIAVKLLEIRLTWITEPRSYPWSPNPRFRYSRFAPHDLGSWPCWSYHFQTNRKTSKSHGRPQDSWPRQHVARCVQLHCWIPFCGQHPWSHYLCSCSSSRDNLCYLRGFLHSTKEDEKGCYEYGCCPKLPRRSDGAGAGFIWSAKPFYAFLWARRHSPGQLSEQPASSTVSVSLGARKTRRLYVAIAYSGAFV